MPQENVTTKFKIDISELKAGITEANKQIKLANAEFKAATAGMDDWSKSTEGIQAKLKQLNSVVEAQKSKLAAYRGQLEASEKAYAENAKRAEELKAKLKELADNGVSETSDEYKQYKKSLAEVEKEMVSNRTAADNLRVTVLNQEAAVRTAEREIRNYSASLITLESGSINAGRAEEELSNSTEDLNNSLKDSEKKAKSAGDGFTVFKGVLANLATQAVDAAANALKSLGNTLVNVGEQAVSGYADYEQLVGGVETLFSNLEGTVSAAPTVLENAAKAYKTAGMSANKYMETVTSFSAALVAGLEGDYQKAAEVSDMAIRDMSDNANKMGTSMEAIQNAYQGFSKQNYTMLDNLKLGYGGTKTEMERLIKDAEKMNSAFKAQRNENGDLAMSLDDVYNAIHIVQVEMGIAGTTAKEAGETISGSFGSLSAAWENLVTGFADKGADLPKLMDDVVTAAEGALDNLLPVFDETITGFANAIDRTAPIIADKLPKMVSEFVPPLLDAGITMVGAIIDGVVQALPQLVDTAFTAAGTLLSHIPGLEAFGEWVKEHKGIVLAAAAAWVTFKAAVAIANVISSVTSALSALSGAVMTQITALQGATAAQTAANVAMAAAPYAALAAAIGLVVTELTYYSKSLFDVSEEVKQLQEKQRDLFREIDSGKSTREQELDQLKTKADRYEELRTKMNKTAGEELELKELAGELQSAFGDKIQVVDSLTGEYNDLTNSVEQFIEAEMRAAKMSAYKDKITEFEKAIIEAEDQMAKRAEQHANAGFNILDWNGAFEQQSFINDQNATRAVIDGYKAKIDDIKGKLADAYEDAAKDVSKTAAAGTDKMTTAVLKKQGLPSYVVEMEKNVKESGKKAAEVIETATTAGATTLTKAADAWGESSKAFNRQIKNEQLSLTEQVAGWKKIRDTFVEGSDDWIEANDKVIESQQKLDEETKKSAESMASSAAKAYDTMQTEIKKLQDSYDKALTDRSNEIMSQYNLFDEVPERAEKSADELLKSLNSQVNDIEAFYKNIEALSERGVSDELVESIRAMGVKASAELDAIIGMTDEQLSEYDAAFSKKRDVSAQIAESQLEPLKEETEQGIQDLTATYAEQMAESGTELAVTLLSSLSSGMSVEAGKVVKDVKDTVTKAWSEAFDGLDIGKTVGDTTNTAILAAVNRALQSLAKKMNEIFNRIRKVDIMGIKPFESLWEENPLANLPTLARGGVLKKGQVGLLEGNGAEAVVPLEHNAAWIRAVADDMKQELQTVNIGGGTTTNDNRTTFTQNIYAPKQLSRIELYRQTRNLLALAKEGVVNV